MSRPYHKTKPNKGREPNKTHRKRQATSHDGFRLIEHCDGSWGFLEGGYRDRRYLSGHFFSKGEAAALNACAKRRGVLTSKSTRGNPSFAKSKI